MVRFLATVHMGWGGGGVKNHLANLVTINGVEQDKNLQQKN
jgi:hypothetical protein